MKNRNNVITTIPLAIVTFALSPMTQAVSPAPDGGYAGGNTAEGTNALLSLSTGTYNTALGENAGDNLTTSDSNNIDIGFDVEGLAGESNTIRLGNTDIATTIIRGISGQTIASGATVLVAANGQLGTLTSSARFKEGIKPIDKESEALFSLKPVTFRYRREIDPAGTSQFGLVAEEVEKVNPDLVTRDENGRVHSVRYDRVDAMLLNEFLKAYRKIQEQEATITQLRKEVETVIAHARDQDSKIQKVSDRIEINKAVPEVASNHPRR